MTLFELVPYEKEMERLKVCEVARSRDGFLHYFKRIGGNPARVSKSWQYKRDLFIARTLGVYKYHQEQGHNTDGMRLSLIAWSYKPD
jgi:hypothetical protein